MGPPKNKAWRGEDNVGCWFSRIRGREVDLRWMGGGCRPRKVYFRCLSYSVGRTRAMLDGKDRTDSKEFDRRALAISGFCC